MKRNKRIYSNYEFEIMRAYLWDVLYSDVANALLSVSMSGPTRSDYDEIFDEFPTPDDFEEMPDAEVIEEVLDDMTVDELDAYLNYVMS